MLKYLLYISMITSTVTVGMDRHEEALIDAIQKNNLQESEYLLKKGIGANCFAKYHRHILEKAKTVRAAPLLFKYGTRSGTKRSRLISSCHI